MKWLERQEFVPPPPATLLELGCGNGLVASLAARKGYTVFGVDISLAAIEWAKDSFLSCGLSGKFRHGSVSSMPEYADAMFDIVVDGNCFHCIIGSDRVQCLKEVRRITSKRGVFLISTMCGVPKTPEIEAQFDARTRCLYKDGHPYRTLKTREEIVAEILAAGFKIVESKTSENPWWDHLTILARLSGELEESRAEHIHTGDR